MRDGKDQTSRNAAQLPPNIHPSPAPPPSGQQVYRARETNADLRLKQNIAIFRIGIAEMVIGGLSLSLSIIPLILVIQGALDGAYTYLSDPDDPQRAYTVIAPGFWGGLLTMIAGILGYGTKGDQSQSMYLANMIFASFLAIAASASCITAVLTVVVTIGGLSGLGAVHILISMLNAAAAMVAVVHSLLTWNRATSAAQPPANGHGFNLRTVPAVGYQYATDATPNLRCHANMSQTSTQPFVGVNNGQQLPPYLGLSEQPLPYPSSGMYYSQPTYAQSMNYMPVMPHNVHAHHNGAFVTMAPTLMTQGPHTNDPPSTVAQNNASATAVQIA